MIKSVLLANLFAATAVASRTSNIVSTNNDKHDADTPTNAGLRGWGRPAERQLKHTKTAHEIKKAEKLAKKLEKKVKHSKIQGEVQVDPPMAVMSAAGSNEKPERKREKNTKSNGGVKTADKYDKEVNDAAEIVAMTNPTSYNGNEMSMGFFRAPEVVATEAPEEPSVEVPCPAHYDHTATYSAGDIVEMSSDQGSNIFACLDGPNEEYCSIPHKDDSWDEVQKGYWEKAWNHVSPCKMAAEESVVVVAEADAVTSTGATSDWEATDTTSTGAAAEAGTVIAATADVNIDYTTSEDFSSSTAPPQVSGIEYSLPSCPPAYEPTKTDYVAGDLAEVEEEVFKCHSNEVSLSNEGQIVILSYEQYCNTAEWDDALLDENTDAKELWDNCWVLVGACEPSSLMEVMEEEASVTEYEG